MSLVERVSPVFPCLSFANILGCTYVVIVKTKQKKMRYEQNKRERKTLDDALARRWILFAVSMDREKEKKACNVRER